MNTDDENDYLNLKFIKNFITDEQRRLEEDKLKFSHHLHRYQGLKRTPSHVDQRVPLENITSNNITEHKSLNNVDVEDRVKVPSVGRDQITTYMIRNSREEEINKFIEKISKPREQVLPKNEQVRRSYLKDTTNSQFVSPVVNIREREKEQLSEKLSTSESPFSNISSRYIGKNLYSSLSFNEKQNNLENVCNENKNKSDRFITSNGKYLTGCENLKLEEQEDYLRAKYNHPRIVISHTPECDTDQGNNMVRIGEFSPLNPNVPGGATVLGLGDWDERRQILLQKYRQSSRSPSPSPLHEDFNRSVRSIAVQTDTINESSSLSVEKVPQHDCLSKEKSLHSYGQSGLENLQASHSPIPKCFENLTEKEIKEFIYRQELQRQIEEKNRLKEEMKKKDMEEEAKIEAKIQRDLEKIRRQYEEERLHRLELAIKRQEQEDLLRQKLAFEQQKATQESKTMRRSLKKSVSPVCKQFEKSTQSDFKKSSKLSKLPHSQSLTERCAASALSSVQKELRQSLLKPSDDSHSLEGPGDIVSAGISERISPTHKRPANLSVSPPISTRTSRQVDILAQKAVFDTGSKTGSWTNRNNSFTTRDKLKEVDDILKQPLLEPHDLPPVSLPLLHATIPPLTSSLTQKSSGNIGVLEDKWKVPYREQDADKHNGRILTQLGTFRRQLQEESLRMRQRVRDDSS